MESALAAAAKIGRWPLIIRPAFTCGGTGGGIAYNVDEFKDIVAGGLAASMTSQVRVVWWRAASSTRMHASERASKPAPLSEAGRLRLARGTHTSMRRCGVPACMLAGWLAA